MTLKFAGLGVGLGLVAGLLASGLVVSDAGAQSPPRTTAPKTGGPVNYSYMAGPHTRIFVTKRSWLDAGTEVLPGDRKFTDYVTGGPDAFDSFSRLNSHLDTRRQPLSTPADVGGYPTGFPLPPY